MNRLIRFCLLFAVLVPALFAFQLTNQKKNKPRDTTIRNLAGVVTLPNGSPAEGAVVKLKNLKNLQVRSYIADAQGKYQFQNLSTNIDYEVRCDFKEMTCPPRTLSVFDSRLDAVINLKLEPAEKSGSGE